MIQESADAVALQSCRAKAAAEGTEYPHNRATKQSQLNATLLAAEHVAVPCDASIAMLSTALLCKQHMIG